VSDKWKRGRERRRMRRSVVVVGSARKMAWSKAMSWPRGWKRRARRGVRETGMVSGERLKGDGGSRKVSFEREAERGNLRGGRFEVGGIVRAVLWAVVL
jgi:hypothetical protein